MKLIKEHIDEGIKHLTGRSKEEINKLPPREKLIEGSKRGYIDLVQQSIEEGVNLKILGNVALQYAANNKHYDIVNLLIDNGADIHKAISWAKIHLQSNVNILKQFIKKDVNESIKHLSPRSEDEITKYYEELEEKIRGWINTGTVLTDLVEYLGYDQNIVNYGEVGNDFINVLTDPEVVIRAVEEIIEYYNEDN